MIQDLKLIISANPELGMVLKKIMDRSGRKVCNYS